MKKDPTDEVILPIPEYLIDDSILLSRKICKMCLEYTNMESTNNKSGTDLLFKIQELTKSLNSINGTFTINPFLSEADKERILKYKSIENVYFWMKTSENNQWEIVKFINGFFYRIDKSGDKLKGCDLITLGERISHNID